MSNDVAVHTEELTKFYGSRRGIEDLTLEVRAGEVLGFLGPNGAGKTTTIRLLLDFLRPTRGHATVLGLDGLRSGPEVRSLDGAPMSNESAEARDDCHRRGAGNDSTRL